jgi:hypothetical protein
MWPTSYEGVNNWYVCTLVPKTEADKKEAGKSFWCVLNAHIARMSLIMREGEVGAVGVTNEAVMGYYLIKWLSKQYTLKVDTAGSMSRMIPARTMVANALYFNRVQCAPHWYTPSSVRTAVEVKYVMQTGLQLQPISTTNALPLTCARAEATQEKGCESIASGPRGYHGGGKQM